MQSPLSEPEPATVTSENPLTIRYDDGVISFHAKHLHGYTPKNGDRVIATYHHGNEDHIVLGLIIDTQTGTPTGYIPAGKHA